MERLRHIARENSRPQSAAGGGGAGAGARKKQPQAPPAPGAAAPYRPSAAEQRRWPWDGPLPPLGASPDGVAQWRAGDPWAPSPSGGAEVIEIKNVCPFRDAHPPGRGRGGGSARFVVSDRGPPPCFPAQHVAQLQLEMLSAGCRSGLLAARSATRGTAVWRMQRDDEYLAELLRQVGRFHADFVLTGRGIPEEVLADTPAHAAFLARTAALAREAALLCVVDGRGRRPAAPGTDERPFVDAP